MTLLAALPLLMPFVMLLLLKQNGLRSSLVSSLVALATATAFMPQWTDIGTLGLRASGQAIAIGIGVLTVLFPGLLLYRLQDSSGSMQVLTALIRRHFPQEGIQLLALLMGVSPFVEAISGFGVSVLVVAPLLLALGYSALQAGTLALLSQISVPLGALGVGTMVGAQLAGEDTNLIGASSLLLSAPLPIICALLMLRVAAKSQHAKTVSRPFMAFWPVAILAGLTKAVADYTLTLWFGVEVAGALASLLTLAVIMLAGRKSVTRAAPAASTPHATRASHHPEDAQQTSSASTSACVKAGTQQYPCTQIRENTAGFSAETTTTSSKSGARTRDTGRNLAALGPYIFLIAALLLTRGISPLQHTLQNTLTFEPFGAGFRYAPFYLPGFWVLLAALSVLIFNRMTLASLIRTTRTSWKQFWPAGLTILFFLLLAQIMTLSGMAGTLAQAGSRFGEGYAFIAPVLATLGGWLTGSTTGGNAMFIPLQVAAAQQTGLSVTHVVAMQNAIASYATMGSPARATLVAATLADKHIEQPLVAVMIRYVLVATVVIACVYAF
ncbi:MAG: L-lactate permease [Lautropia sp.]|nr:L-lactate permease [Lautropia sp.]